MAIFPIFCNGRHQFCVSSTLRKPETQTLGGSVIGSFALGCIFGELWPFFPFSVMADTNFAFPSTLGKPETQTLGGSVIGRRHVFYGHFSHFLRTPILHFSTLGDPNFRGVGNWKFCSRMRFWGAMAIFPIFCNGRHQFCISVDTRKTGDPNFRGVSNWKFCSRTRFWGAMAIFPIFCNGRHQFCISVNTQKTGDPNFRGVGNWKFCSRMHFWGATAIFPIFCNG